MSRGEIVSEYIERTPLPDDLPEQAEFECAFRRQNIKRVMCSAYCFDRCIGEAKCKYAVSAESVAASERKRFARIRRLPTNLQSYISNKYYGGETPWDNGRRMTFGKYWKTEEQE